MPIASVLPTFALAILVLLGAASPATNGLSDLAVRLLADAQAIARDDDGRPAAIFGVAAHEARLLFLPVGRDRALPPGYVPPDLDWSLGRPVRAVIVGDLAAMRSAAARDGVDLAVVSGYRSAGQQAAAFEASAWRQIARAGGSMSREEAEARAARFVAPPGHSQHQLGTAVDLSTRELSYAVQPRFAETAAGRWVADHAWAYGFVLPYPEHGESRTGYAFEPWHLRWVGRPLAAVLHADGYLADSLLVVDDYLRALEELLDAEGVS